MYLWVCDSWPPKAGVKHTLSASVFDPGVSEVLILQGVKVQLETDE